MDIISANAGLSPQLNILITPPPPFPLPDIVKGYIRTSVYICMYAYVYIHIYPLIYL